MIRNAPTPTLALLTALAALSASIAEPLLPNVLHNPGFEAGEAAPAGWSFNHRGTQGEIAWDRGRAHGGRASVRLTNRTAEQTGNVVESFVCDPPLAPGSLVTFSAFAAAEDATGDGPRIIFNLLSTSGVRQDASAGCVGGTHDFVEVRGQALTARPTNRLVIYLCHYGQGTVWWDDATVTVQRGKATTTIPRPVTERRLPEVSTDDGLSISLSESGEVAAVRLGDTALAATAPHSGLWIRPFGEDTKPVTGHLTTEGNAVLHRGEDEGVGLRVEARFAPRGNALRCTGFVEDMTGEDRGVDVFFALPVGREGWRWGQSIREEVPLTGDPLSVEFTTFSSVSNPEAGQGLALAVPATSPCDCEFTFDREFGYAVRFRFGLSSAAAGPLNSRAPFSFVLYRIDGRWGLRDAARRYYELYPEAFEKRVEREGLWMFGSPRFDLPDPQNYAFHEGGPAGWEDDDEHGIATCPYIIPGQREVKHLDKLPTDNAEAVALFHRWQPPEPRRDGDWGAGVKAIIENCLLHAADGRPHVLIRNTPWGGNSVTFPLNATPGLFADSDRPTIAKSLLKHVADMHREIPGLDGTYVDSLGAWGDYLNHRREHFRYAQLPLTYNPMTGKPVVHNRFALLEFLWALRELMHEQGKLVFPNGIHQSRRFHFFAADVMGVEGRHYLEQKRVMAYRKPFLLLIYNIHDKPAEMQRYYHLCTFYGIYPSFANMRVYETPASYAPVARLNNRFVPVLRAITGAGWRPVTHARSSEGEVWVERWGPGEDGATFLTVHNAAAEERQPTITLDCRSMGLGEVVELEFRDRLSDLVRRAPVARGVAEATVPMSAEHTRVLQVVVQPGQQ